MTKQKTYLTIFKYDRPYPVSKEYRIEAGNMGTAMARGFRELRKDEKGRRFSEITVKIISL